MPPLYKPALQSTIRAHHNIGNYLDSLLYGVQIKGKKQPGNDQHFCVMSGFTSLVFNYVLEKYDMIIKDLHNLLTFLS